MTSEHDTAITVRGLTRRYGATEAIRGIDVTVRRGEVFALLGPNGAGKTTTVEILQGYRRRDAGTVSVLGVDPARADDAWRCRVGIVHQRTGAFTELSVEEVVAHYASFYPHPLDAVALIDLVGLGEKRRSRCSKLSGGQLRRLDVALGIVGDPELVFLDEPTTGFDPQARRQAWALLERLTDLGCTVLLTTHALDEAERLADRLAVIIDGRIVAEGAPVDLCGPAAATVRFLMPTERRSEPLPALPGTRAGDVDTDAGAGGAVRIVTEEPAAAVAALVAWGGELPALTVTRPSLEDTYLELVSTHARAPREEVA